MMTTKMQLKGDDSQRSGRKGSFILQESAIASIWVHRESNLIFILNSEDPRNQRKKFAFVFAFAQCK